MRIIKSKHKKAFTMIELALVIVVTGVILSGLLKVTQHFTEVEGSANERAFNTIMKNGIQNSFIDIIDAFQADASTFNDNSSDWGWTNVPNTSPLPTSENTTVPGLLFSLDTGVLSAAGLASLQGKILSNFNGACTLDTAARLNGDIKIDCPRLRQITYTAGASVNVNTLHALGTPLDPSLSPTVTVTFTREYPTNRGKANTAETYTFNMDDAYSMRRNYSLRRLTTLRMVLENFENRAVARELQNASTGNGLNSMDDIFVPWFWKAFGDDATRLGELCNTGGGTTCANFLTDDVWRSTILDKGLYINRVITNLLAGDLSFAVDGFNNPIFIYPIMSQCPTATNDISACAVTAPQLPRDNYINFGNPPYISAIYTPSFSDKTVSAPDYARIYIAY